MDYGSTVKSCRKAAVFLNGIIGKENDDGENGSELFMFSLKRGKGYLYIFFP